MGRGSVPRAGGCDPEARQMADGVVVGLDRAVEEEDRAAVTLAPTGDEGRYRIAEVVPAASGRWVAEVFGRVLAKWWRV